MKKNFFFIKMRAIFLFLSIIVLSDTTMAFRILAIFPYPSHSHQVVNHALTQGLAERGHELTVFTANPMNKNIKNYREISLDLLEAFKKKFSSLDSEHLEFWHLLKFSFDVSATICDATFSHPEMIKLLSTNKTTEIFDLIIVGAISGNSLYYLSDIFDAPLIGITSFTDVIHIGYLMGNPLSSRFIPHAMLGYPDDMNFLQRLRNHYYNLRHMYEYYIYNLPIQGKILKKHFPDSPPVEQLIGRIQMFFTSSHPHLAYPRPIVPNVKQIGGLRLGKMNKTISKDLKKILDNAGNGFIYFSLGSNIQSISMNNDTLDKFIAAFSELSYKIIWKFESESLIGKPDNVYINKWIPQQGVLAHPNIKLFIYQGGLQSTEEAIDNGVPMLGFPIFSDQHDNLNNLIKRGVAIALDINTIDKNQIKENIHEMIVNTSYRDNTMKLRELLYDRPQHPLNEAIWWVEHVIRHRGAHHINARSRELSWVTVELLDVVGFLLLIFVILFLIGRTLWRLAIAMIKVHRLNYFNKINRPSTMNKNKFKSS